MEILFFVVLALVLVGSLVWHGSRSQDVLQEWAGQNGYAHAPGLGSVWQLDVGLVE